MLQYWEAVQNALIDRSAQELIGAMAVALILSLIVTGLYNLGRRKIQDGVMLMTVLVLLACVVAMTLTAGFFTRRRDGSLRRTGPAAGFYGHPWAEPDRASMLAQWLLERADRDRDGRLSEEEAAGAAARFIREGNTEGTGPLNLEGLTYALRTNSIVPPPAWPRPFETRPARPPRILAEPRDRGPEPYDRTKPAEPTVPPHGAAEPVQD